MLASFEAHFARTSSDERNCAHAGMTRQWRRPLVLERFSGEMDTGPRKENASNMRECKIHLRLLDWVLPQRTNLI
jgi:hypothetical protein